LVVIESTASDIASISGGIGSFFMKESRWSKATMSLKTKI